jgi:tetratricopeptide (TPR) repeat protein
MKLPDSNLKKTLCLALILVVTCVLYFRVAGFGFISVWDDNLNVLNNSYIKNFSFDGIKTIFSGTTPINEPRFTVFTYAIDYKLWQLNPKMYHLENLFLHLLCIILVFLLACKLFSSVRIPALVAAMFALHPFRIESVAWVSGRKDLLFTFFFLLAILFYIRYLKREKIWLFLLVLLMSWLSFLSKIQAVTIPVILLMIDSFYGRKITVKVMLEKFLVAVLILSGFFHFADIIALICFYLLFIYSDALISKIGFLKRMLGKSQGTNFGILQRNAVILIFFLLFYTIVFKTIAFRFMNLYDNLVELLVILWLLWFGWEEWLNRMQFKAKSLRFFQTWHIWILFAAVTIAGISFFFLKSDMAAGIWNTSFSSQFTFKDQVFMAGYSFFCYLLYVLFPFRLSSLRPYPDFTALHLPKAYYVLTVFAILFIIGFIWMLLRMKKNRQLMLFGFLFFAVNIFLFMHIIPIQGRVIIAERYTYLAYMGLFLMAGVLFSKMDALKTKIPYTGSLSGLLLCAMFFAISFGNLNTWKDEFTLLNDQVKKNPEYPVVYLNRSTLNINKANYVAAVGDLDKAIELDPAYYQAYYNRALAFSNLRLFDKVTDNCTMALKVAPAFAEAHYLRAYAYAQMKQFTLAIAGYSEAIKLNPFLFLAYYNRANARVACMDYDRALRDYDKAILLNPKFAEAYSGRGVVHFFKGDFQGSLPDYSKAIELSPANGNYFYNRALSYKNLSDLNHCCSDLQTALQKGYEPARDVIANNCR